MVGLYELIVTVKPSLLSSVSVTDNGTASAAFHLPGLTRTLSGRRLARKHQWVDGGDRRNHVEPSFAPQGLEHAA